MSDGRKPIHRPRNILLLLLLLGLTWIGLSIHTALTATPGAAVDYQQKFVDLVESYQKDTAGEPNGWPIFLEAVERLDAVEKQITDAAGGHDPPPDWPSGDGRPFDYSSIRDPRAPRSLRDATALAMDRLREGGVYDRLGAVAAAPRMVRPKQQGDMIGILLPELGKARRLARLGGARMYLTHVTGDNAELVASFEQALAMGRICLSQATLIDRLVGVAIVALALGELRSEMVDAPPDAATCRALLAAMDRQLGRIPPASLPFEGERICTLDTIQWTHTDDGRGGGRLLLDRVSGLSADLGTGLPAGVSRHKMVNVVGFLFPGKAETTAKANEFYDGLVAFSKLPRRDRAKSSFDPDKFADGLPRGFMVLKILIPAVGKALQSMDQSEAQVAGTRVMLALEVYLAEHGAYPENLDALVPSILPSLPIDPYAGKPYCFRRLAPGEDPLGRGFLLYSVGADGADNGGTAASGVDVEAFNGKKPGSDYIFNVPRE